MKSKNTNNTQRFTHGSTFNERYEYVRQVGCGGVGEVYQFLDKELENQAVAIKILHHYLSKDTSTLQRFQNEVFVSRQLAHPNIVRVYDFAAAEGLFYLTLEYVSGCDLDEVADSYLGRRLPESDALYLLQQIAEGLAFAHRQDIVHRDIKPQNIIVDKTGLAKLSDFGFAYSIETDSGLTRTGELIGSPAYLAPEQFIKAEPDTRADVYAFGILAYELLCGELPYSSNSYYALAKQHREQEFPLKRLQQYCKNEKLCDLIASCCHKDPDNRPDDATQIRETFKEVEKTEKSKKTLKTIVTQRRKDSFIHTSKVEARQMRGVLFGALLVVLISVFFTSNARRRVAGDLALMEQHTGVSTQKLRSALLFSTGDIPSIEVLRELAHPDKEVVDAYEVAVFLKRGVNLKTRLDDPDKNTILHYLAESFNNQIHHVIEHAKSKHAINERNIRGETPLIRALKSGQKEFLQRLLVDRYRFVSPDKDRRREALHNERYLYSISEDPFEQTSIGTLIPGADITIPDKEGNYPVHIAAADGDQLALQYLLEEFRYKPRFSESTRDPRGHTALHICVLDNNIETLSYLLAQNFDVDMRDSSGKTPLMLALAQKPPLDTRAIIALLLNAGASLEARDNAGLTALDYAKKSNRLDLLREAML